MKQTNWQKFGQLTLIEQCLLIQAVILLACNVFGLRWFGFKRWQQLLNCTITTKSVKNPDSLQLVQAQRISWLINAAATRGIVSATCLPRSMALWWMLQQHGIATELRIGVRKESTNFAAHAWIEYNGQVLNDSAAVGMSFTPFAKRFDLIHE